MKNTGLLLLLLLGWSCGKKADTSDASGTFEAVETTISAEVAAQVISVNAEEGQEVQQGQLLVQADSTQLWLKLQQTEAQRKAILSRMPDIPVQLASLREQVRHQEQEQHRIEQLFAAEAATRKQLDDAKSMTASMQRQLKAMESSLGITSNGLHQEAEPLTLQAQQLRDQLDNCRITAPFAGTLLTRYAEQGELLMPGKPVVKLANMKEMTLRVYVTGTQYPSLKAGAPVQVMVDGAGKDSPETTLKGTIEWISPKAEFTPKTIQTKEERANLVYAVKIRVPNNGELKIGMYGSAKF